MKYIAVIFMAVAIIITISATDWKCLNDCLNKGYIYDYCVKFCSY